MARTDADRQYEYYPAFLDLVRKRVVVIGGGTIATQKVRGLLPCGAHPIVVIAPTVHAVIRKQADAGRVTWEERAYVAGDLAGADLAFAATNDRSLNAQVAREARDRAVPVLAVDDIPFCDFIAPAVVKRGHLTVAISTSGRSPALASHTRRKLERVITPQWGELLDVASAVRDRLGSHKSQVDPEAWQRALDDEVKRLIWAGDRAGAEELLWNRIAPEVV